MGGNAYFRFEKDKIVELWNFAQVAPAETFRKTIEKLQTFYLYGLTATPFRKYSDEKLIFTHIEEIIATIKPVGNDKNRQLKLIFYLQMN